MPQVTVIELWNTALTIGLTGGGGKVRVEPISR